MNNKCKIYILLNKAVLLANYYSNGKEAVNILGIDSKYLHSAFLLLKAFILSL